MPGVDDLVGDDLRIPDELLEATRRKDDGRGPNRQQTLRTAYGRKARRNLDVRSKDVFDGVGILFLRDQADARGSRLHVWLSVRSVRTLGLGAWHRASDQSNH